MMALSSDASASGVPSASVLNDQMAIHEKLIEAKEDKLQRLVAENKAKLREVEEELSLLRRDLKLTSLPKKQALELMRKKIEESSERVRVARDVKQAAVAALTRAEEALAAEEASKAALVSDLNSLILQSTVQQFKALESLESRMDGLSARVAAPEAPPPEGVAMTVAVSSPRAAGPSSDAAAGGAAAAPGAPADDRTAAVAVARAEMEAAAAVAAAEARSRHVALPGRGGAAPRPEGPRMVLGAASTAGGSAPAVASGSHGFAGFAV